MEEEKERIVLSNQHRIPLHLITGFLGSGKTTFLRHLLDYCLGNGLKPAIMMNEYGDINIDGTLLRGQGYSVREMTNGCICCTIGGTLGLALQDVAALRPDVILLEATGLADPVELIDQATKEEVLPLVCLASLVAILDPINFERLSDELHAGIRSQTEMADFVLLNKRDLADSDTLKAYEARVRKLNPRAKIISTERGLMDYRTILSRRDKSTQSRVRRDNTSLHDHFHTQTILCGAPMIRERFENMLKKLPKTIWRAKGFVRFTDSEEQWMFQFVGGDYDMEWVDLLPEPQEHIVFIGKQLDRVSIETKLRYCEEKTSKEKTHDI